MGSVYEMADQVRHEGLGWYKRSCISVNKAKSSQKTRSILCHFSDELAPAAQPWNCET